MESIKMAEGLKYPLAGSEYDVEVFFNRYAATGGWAIELISVEYDAETKEVMREPFAMASVCLVNETCGNDEVWIKNCSENEGMSDFLLKYNILVGDATRFAKSGFVVAPCYRLHPDVIANLAAAEKAA